MVFSSFIRWSVLTNTLPEFSFTLLKFSLRFWSFRSPFWHKSLVGAGLAAVCSHWLLSFWLTASWPGSEDVSVAPPVWMWASLSGFLFHFNYIKQGSSNLILEGLCPAEFSSNLPQHTCLEVSSIPSKTLISCFRCVWLELELNSAGTPALQDRTWWPLI